MGSRHFPDRCLFKSWSSSFSGRPCKSTIRLWLYLIIGSECPRTTDCQIVNLDFAFIPNDSDRLPKNLHPIPLQYSRHIGFQLNFWNGGLSSFHGHFPEVVLQMFAKISTNLENLKNGI